MKCPECGVWVRVIETRNESDGSKRRRYECANLHRFSTRETIVESKTSKKKPGGPMS